MEDEKVLLSKLLQCLVECSEKAARIAQIFRDEDDLFQLLVQEKSQIEINKCFFKDFKTLADVLVQETIKRDVGEQFPSVTSHIQGEEQNSFENALGESINIELSSSEDDTFNLLNKVLDGRICVAKTLSKAVHCKVSCEIQYESSLEISTRSIGIWIDPIDSTAEYIKAIVDETEDHSIQKFGLKCVSVLIGVYDLITGDPIIGVVNQPFFYYDELAKKWRSNLYWGVCYQSERATSFSLESLKKSIVVLSNTETQAVKDILKSKYTTIQTAGSGHKSLLVASGKADLYILSSSSTFLWDVCGPHAILAAQGGGVIKFRDLMQNTSEEVDLKELQISYQSLDSTNSIESFRNVGGIVAYKNPTDVLKLRKLFLENGYVWPEDKYK